MKIRSEQAEYAENAKFWTRKGDNLTMVGDFLGRLPSIKLLDPVRGEKILDAGCGAGFISRRLAKLGANVWGCDRAPEMIAQARAEEKKSPLGIEYKKACITRLPYFDKFFDAVSCIAVLMHDSPVQIREFVEESRRVLRVEGRLIISITHPDIYQPGSPNRTGEADWVQFRPLENKPMSESQRFEETYRNSNGGIFTSTVWYHSRNIFINLFKEVGIEVLHEQSTFVTQEVLEKCNHSGGAGLPAFYQIMGRRL